MILKSFKRDLYTQSSSSLRENWKSKINKNSDKNENSKCPFKFTMHNLFQAYFSSKNHLEIKNLNFEEEKDNKKCVVSAKENFMKNQFALLTLCTKFNLKKVRQSCLDERKEKVEIQRKKSFSSNSTMSFEKNLCIKKTRKLINNKAFRFSTIHSKF